MAVAWLIWPFVLSLTAPSANSITESESLLNFKKSLTNTKSLESWTPDSEPCGESQRWVGLLCTKNSVFGIQIEQMGLSGDIDVTPLKDLPSLRTISIMNNSFSGNIPEFNQLTALKSIYISGNQFSGNIPSNYFATMVSLKKAWLSNNKFSCVIPVSLATTLPNLMELRLENNQFIGRIPNFAQTTLTVIDLSNNLLTGEIPPGLSKFDAKVFAGNPGLCGAKLATTCTQPRNLTGSINIEGTMKDADKTKYYLAFTTLGVLLVVVLITLAFRKKKKKRRWKKPRRTSEQDSGDEQQIQVTVDESRSSSRQSKSSLSGELTNKSKGVVGAAGLVMVNEEKGVFGLPDLMKAAAHVLNNPGGGSSRPSSSGGVGSAYKAVLSSGVTVVVKRITVMNQVSVDVFDREIRKLGSLRHKNILTPLAYHFRQDEKLLVFEFAPNLSLLHRLHGDHGEGLDWPSRLKIIQGIASGMWYLHTELGFLNLPHGNLKSSNIFLAEDGEPLVSEFGLQRLINPEAQSQSLVAYKSPEAERDGTVSAKSDVFSFGVVVLEIMTGKFPSQYAGLNRAGGTNLVEWIGSAVEQGGWMDLLHPAVVNAAADDKILEEEIENVLRIGVRCTGEDPDRRPNMIEVIDELTIEDSNDDFITIET